MTVATWRRGCYCESFGCVYGKLFVDQEARGRGAGVPGNAAAKGKLMSMSFGADHHSTYGVPLVPGDLLADKYRIESVIGRGGMGVVFAARHKELGNRFAVKVLLPEMLSVPEALARFLREARALARLKSRHTAQVIDVGTLDDATPYMVMEYLEGADLGAVLEARGRLPVTEAVHYVMQALEAVAEAHAAGIVHRDLKPDNLFLAEQRDGLIVKVLDFGISKSTNDALDGRITATQTTVGSPVYMPPEQVRSSSAVDARSDVWAVGVIVYELLVGRAPFTGTTMGEVFAAVLEVEYEPLRTARPDVPKGLADVVSKCLRRRLEERYQDVAALAAALAPFGPASSQASVERITTVVRSGTGLPKMSLHESLRVARVARGQAETLTSWAPPPRKSLGRLGKTGVAVGALVAVAAAATSFFAFRALTRESASASASGDVRPPVAASAIALAPTPSAPTPAAPAASAIDPAAQPTSTGAPGASGMVRGGAAPAGHPLGRWHPRHAAPEASPLPPAAPPPAPTTKAPPSLDERD